MYFVFKLWCKWKTYLKLNLHTKKKIQKKINKKIACQQTINAFLFIAAGNDIPNGWTGADYVFTILFLLLEINMMWDFGQEKTG